MTSSIKIEPKSARDLSYYRQRFRNRTFAKLIEFLSEQSEEKKLTRRDIATLLNKDPAQITRLLNQPSNLTLDTISDLLFAVDAEPDPPEPVLFEHRSPSNYMHPLVAKLTRHGTPKPAAKTETTGDSGVVLDPPTSIKHETVAA